MRSARLRKTTKEMTAHFAAIQQGVRSKPIHCLIENIEPMFRSPMQFVDEN